MKCNHVERGEIKPCKKALREKSNCKLTKSAGEYSGYKCRRCRTKDRSDSDSRSSSTASYSSQRHENSTGRQVPAAAVKATSLREIRATKTAALVTKSTAASLMRSHPTLLVSLLRMALAKEIEQSRSPATQALATRQDSTRTTLANALVTQAVCH